MSDMYIGLMSGTSLDGVDGVLVDFSDGGSQVRGHASAPFDAALRADLLALNRAGDDEIHRAALAANALVRVYADIVASLLAQTGCPAADVSAIGAHGQTVRHRPQEFDGTGYTTQINNPALLAELTGIDVVADFRSRDVAAGGQGAPLASGLHLALFAQRGRTVSVLNLGGIANLTVLPNDGAAVGFDCGPGNGLMDHWCQQHTGSAFDDSGRWAATGTPLSPLLARLMADTYFDRPPPKSTGRDHFNPEWLNAHLDIFPKASPPDVQATLAELTAATCACSVMRFAKGSAELIVCGGGAYNDHLMARLADMLPNVAVAPSGKHGLPPLQVEAAAFAWLARCALRREPGNLPAVTGALGRRVLGAIHPAL